MASRRKRSRTRFEHSDFEDSEEGHATGHGGPIYAHEVDLHGCTVEASQRRLSQALTRCRAGGLSPVLVITGKGHGSHGGRAKLAPAVDAWLRGEQGRSCGVASIRKVRGGGAFEVTLSRP